MNASEFHKKWRKDNPIGNWMEFAEAYHEYKLKALNHEQSLIRLAQEHPDDKTANTAMKQLRKLYDSTYVWCEDCDGLVTKSAECCLNVKHNNSTQIDLLEMIEEIENENK